MKKFAFVFLLFYDVGVVCLFAQESEFKKREVGITFSPSGTNDVITFVPKEGAAWYSGTGFWNVGVMYVAGINKWLSAETGLEFSHQYIQIHPNLPPGEDESIRDDDFSLVNIPLMLRADFLKYFFVNGGLLFSLDPSMNNPIGTQTGLGANLGLGLKYEFKNRMSLFVNPYLRLYSILPFALTDHEQGVVESGFRIGLTYNLKK